MTVLDDKAALAQVVGHRFGCARDRAVYYTRDFAIRFSKARCRSFSNTVLSLSALQKYDDRPFLVCVCTPTVNHLLLANSSFLRKISHSSRELRTDNIKGSFNGTDIMRTIGKMANVPENFDELFAIHQNITFEENLARLVEATNDIASTGIKFDVSVGDRLQNILDAPNRAIAFSEGDDYTNLNLDLDARMSRFENEILVAACIDNANLRGRIIEYLIAGEDALMREQLIDALVNERTLPRLVTRDGLGDYGKLFCRYLPIAHDWSVFVHER